MDVVIAVECDVRLVPIRHGVVAPKCSVDAERQEPETGARVVASLARHHAKNAAGSSSLGCRTLAAATLERS